MKHIFTVLILLISLTGYSQSVPDSRWGVTTLPVINTTTGLTALYFGSSYSDTKVISTWDTTVLFKGIDTIQHEHSFVAKSNKQPSFGSCAVLHGPEGCSWNWGDNDLICTVCLKNLNVKESRTSVTIKKADPYQDAKDRLTKIKKDK